MPNMMTLNAVLRGSQELAFQEKQHCRRCCSHGRWLCLQVGRVLGNECLVPGRSEEATLPPASRLQSKGWKASACSLRSCVSWSQASGSCSSPPDPDLTHGSRLEIRSALSDLAHSHLPFASWTPNSLFSPPPLSCIRSSWSCCFLSQVLHPFHTVICNLQSLHDIPAPVLTRYPWSLSV